MGELSLLDGRPLWYSLSVRSAVVKVACLELSVLREYFHGTGGDIEALLRVAAEADRNLYSIAVQQQVRPPPAAASLLCSSRDRSVASPFSLQALLILSGDLELSMFTPSMKALIKHVMGMGSHLKQHRGDHQTGGDDSAGETTVSVSKPEDFASGIVDMSRLARSAADLLEDLSRSNPMGATASEIRQTTRCVMIRQSRRDCCALRWAVQGPLRLGCALWYWHPMRTFGSRASSKHSYVGDSSGMLRSLSRGRHWYMICTLDLKSANSSTRPLPSPCGTRVS